MVTEIDYRDHVSVYPGVFEPPSEDAFEGFGNVHTRLIKPLVKIGNQPRLYKVEIDIPGFNKEDFFITAGDGVLSIAGIRKIPASQKSILSSFDKDYEFIKKEIRLPGNIDSDFSTATYSNGLLKICFFKADYPVMNKKHRIIIY